MSITPSIEDLAFKARFEAGDVAPAAFNHRAHLRLVYVYLCQGDTGTANARMRRALKAFLHANNVPASKYHETLTFSWVQAVKHFMVKAGTADSFDAFIAADDRLLDTDIMLTHYARETLFSDAARMAFVAPDIQAIPQHS